jgi:uncharacterized protein (TIGR00369 family)
MDNKLTTLEFLKRQIDGTLPQNAITEMRYPTAISKTLGFRISRIDIGFAELQLDANPEKHGNQQGTIHGGMLSELADAAIGTAHSTAINEGETFTSIDLQIKFFRPAWESVLTASAKQIQHGKTLTHYQCEISRDDGKIIALATSTVMTLRGNAGMGR